MVSTGATSGAAGGSGMEYGDSTVAARLSIDIPTEGVQSLREITQEISRFRTEMEAASRSEGDFIGFFQTLPSIANQAANAYKTFADQLERSLAMQQRMAGAVGKWDVQPGSTPDNFKGMSTGMGRSDKDIGQTISDMDRIREMGQAGERQYLNMHQQRGAIRPSDIPSSNSEAAITEATERISNRERVNQERTGGGPGEGGLTGKMGQYGGIAKEIMNEFSAGSGGGVPGMLQRGLSAAAHRLGHSGGGMGTGDNRPPHTSGSVPTPDSGTSGAAPSGPEDGGGGGLGSLMSLLGGGGGLGKAMGVAGLGLTGFQLAQFMGPRLQNLREMGLTRGGGIEEGAGQEIQARMMALNPFITNDQARSVIQSALRDGYTGKEYETVTQFMKQNLTDFGISVQESRDMIKKQMVEGGLTPEAIQAGLEIDKRLSKKGYLSFQDRERAENDLAGTMSDMAVPGGIGKPAAQQITEMFSGNQLLKGKMADIAGSVLNNTNSQAAVLQLAGITPSSDYGEWPTQIAQGGGEALQKAVMVLAKQSGGNKGVFRDAIQQVLGISITQAQANELYRQVTGGGDEASAAQQRIDKESGSAGSSSIESRSTLEEITASAGGVWDTTVGTAADLLSLNFSNIPQRWRNAGFREQTEHIPILDKLVETQGGDPNKILVEDGSGGWKKLQAGDRGQLESLSNGGKWKYAGDESGQSYTLAQSTSAMNSNFGKQDVQVGGAVQIHVSSDPGVKVSAPSSVRLTQNQVNANAAYANATMNGAPPGDR